MRIRLLVALAILAAVAEARGQAASTPQNEPEEPDFAFIAGSAYTQGRNSLQFIHQTALATRRFLDPSGARRNEDAFLWFQRAEYGITDRWEWDTVLPASGSRTRINGQTVSSDSGLADGLVGIRYRFLNEERAPFTLAMGPQLLFPSGSVRKGTGNGSWGFAWDIAVSKDWGGPLFLYQTFNYHVLPSGKDPTPGSAQRFALHGASWATAVGLRALEHTAGKSRHDIHIFLEAGGAWQQSVEPGATVGARQGTLSWVVSPGIRYGFLTSRKTLVEIGVAAPVGLGPNGPKHGLLIQFQYELYFTPPASE